jgi:hypothetical protein
MLLRRLVVLVLMLAVAALGVIACGSPAPQPPTGPGVDPASSTPAPTLPPPAATPEKVNPEVGPHEPRLFMLEPQDESVIDSPFFLRVGVANLPIPVNYVQIHVAIDTPCTAAGSTAPQDGQHISLPTGVLAEPRLNLPLGQHRLCIQAANQDGLVMQGPGLTRIIDVTIQAVEEPGSS